MMNLIVLLFMAGIIGVLVYCQYRLCSHKNGRKYGLCLPIITFGISLLLAISAVFFSAVKGVGSTTVLEESTNEIVEIPNEKPEPTTAGDIVLVAAPILLFCNIPTAVFMLEYALFTTKKREDQEKELDKSQIVDL
ncbi:MAG: hypothetical protein MJ062_01400 [Oscillospiraceae bacterium]|nr:hypothetical protein [Oscillospiraceae bacterium]